jgi:hypothetical protein
MAVADTVKRLSKRLSGIKPASKEAKSKDAGALGKLRALSALPYREQAIWFLNAFWANEDYPALSFKRDAAARETVWRYASKCAALDPSGASGCAVDEVVAHRVMEAMEKTLTVLEMREQLRKVDVDLNKRVSLLEFLLLKFDADWLVLANASKENGAEMDKVLGETQRLVEAAQAQLVACQALAEEAGAAELAAQRGAAAALGEETAARASEADAHAKEAVLARAEEEAHAAEADQRGEEAKVAASVAAIAAEEQAWADRAAHLEKQSQRGSVGVVHRGKAQNELMQHRATETVGIREAKSSQEAALRRQQKAVQRSARARDEAARARKPLLDAKNAAVASRQAAEASRAAAQASAAAAEAARNDAQRAVGSSLAAFNDAEASLAKIKAKFADSNQGRFWFMDRELEHAKSFMSRAQLAALSSKQQAKLSS